MYHYQTACIIFSSTAHCVIIMPTCIAILSPADRIRVSIVINALLAQRDFDENRPKLSGAETAKAW